MKQNLLKYLSVPSLAGPTTIQKFQLDIGVSARLSLAMKQGNRLERRATDPQRQQVRR